MPTARSPGLPPLAPSRWGRSRYSLVSDWSSASARSTRSATSSFHAPARKRAATRSSSSAASSGRACATPRCEKSRLAPSPACSRARLKSERAPMRGKRSRGMECDLSRRSAKIRQGVQHRLEIARVRDVENGCFVYQGDQDRVVAVDRGERDDMIDRRRAAVALVHGALRPGLPCERDHVWPVRVRAGGRSIAEQLQVGAHGGTGAADGRRRILEGQRRLASAIGEYGGTKGIVAVHCRTPAFRPANAEEAIVIAVEAQRGGGDRLVVL